MVDRAIRAVVDRWRRKPTMTLNVGMFCVGLICGTIVMIVGP